MKKLGFVGSVVVCVVITACSSKNSKKADVSLDSVSSTFGMVPASLPENFDVDYGEMLNSSQLPTGTYSLTRIIAHDIKSLDGKKMISAVDHKLVVPGSVNIGSGDKIIGYTNGNIQRAENVDPSSSLYNIVFNIPRSIEITSDTIIPRNEMAWDATVSKDGKATTISVKDMQAQIASAGELLGFQQDEYDMIKHPTNPNITMTIHGNDENVIFYIQQTGKNGEYVNYFLFYLKSDEA